MAVLLSLGFDAYGLEPSAAMQAEALRSYPELSGRLFPFGLALSDELDLGGPFDGILCSAVLMHVPEEELFSCAFTLKRLLRQGERLWNSVPLDLLLLFERLGFKLLRRSEDADRLGRSELRWEPSSPSV